jgi:hypothetical protein
VPEQNLETSTLPLLFVRGLIPETKIDSRIYSSQRIPHHVLVRRIVRFLPSRHLANYSSEYHLTSLPRLHKSMSPARGFFAHTATSAPKIAIVIVITRKIHPKFLNSGLEALERLGAVVAFLPVPQSKVVL